MFKVRFPSVMTDRYPPLDLLQVYRSVVPSNIRKAIRPTARSVYYWLVKREISARELSAVEKRVIKSASEKYKRWQLDDALQELDLVLRENVTQMSALHLKADILARAGRHEDARKITRSILTLSPLDLRAIRRLKALGLSYVFSRRTAEDGIHRLGGTPESFLAASLYLTEGALTGAAIRASLDGLELEPSSATRDKLLYARGLALFTAGKHKQAIKVFASVPNTSGSFRDVVALWGKSLLELGHAVQAEEVLRRIGAYETGAIPFQGTVFAARLAQGKIKKAHQMYRWRTTSVAISEYFKMPQFPKDISLNSGKHKNQEVLLVTEGGPGDEIRLASMYGRATELCHSLAASCDPRLKTILQRSFPQINFIPTVRYRKEVLTTDITSRSLLTDQRLYPCVSDDIIRAAEGKHLVCSNLDLLVELRAKREDFHPASRLAPDPALTARWQSEFAMKNGRRQVGLAWRSMLVSNDRNRHYLKAEDLIPLKHLKDTDFWILQTGITQEELEVFKQAGLKVNDPAIDMKDDFEGQAALISNLDAVVSPLSTMAELSGMLGTLTLIFCRTNEVTWRLNEDGTDIWYENGKLVTGDPIVDIPSLVQNLASEISLVSSRHRGHRP